MKGIGLPVILWTLTDILMGMVLMLLLGGPLGDSHSNGLGIFWVFTGSQDNLIWGLGYINYNHIEYDLLVERVGILCIGMGEYLIIRQDKYILP